MLTAQAGGAEGAEGIPCSLAESDSMGLISRPAPSPAARYAIGAEVFLYLGRTSHGD